MSSKCTFQLAGATDRELHLEFIRAGQATPVSFRLLASTPADVSLSWSAEAQVAAGLIPAMHSGLPLQIDGLLEPIFQRNLGVVQDLLGFWCKDLRKIVVEADTATVSASSSPARQALFFGGGVDSMFSMLRYAGTITDLIYVHGFDVPLAETALRRNISEYMHRVADLFGVNLIEIETDLRSLLDANLSWRYSHGAALATVAHLFANRFSRVFISSTHSYGNLIPCGSHPLLDPLWSRATMEIVHEGADVSRADKVARIATNTNVRRLLRVCWVAPHAERLNCCQCEKCLRTMVALQAVGELHSDEAFRLPLVPAKVRALKLTNNTRDLWEENRELLTATGKDARLLAAVERLLEPSARKRMMTRIRAWNRQRRSMRRQRRQKESGDVR